ncbi:MAG: DUF1636 family protein [Myxococcota bacterium]
MQPDTPNTSTDSAPRVCTLRVCTSCREPGTPRGSDTTRPGAVLLEEIRTMLRNSTLENRVELLATDCLNNCSRHCAASLSGRAAWNFVFGELRPGASAAALLASMHVYLKGPDGGDVPEHCAGSDAPTIIRRYPPRPRSSKR